MDMSEVRRFDAHPHPAHLLRLAARMLREPDGQLFQATHALYEWEVHADGRRLVGYCALGKLAYIAAGRRVPVNDQQVLRSFFGDLLTRRMSPRQYETLSSTIVRLNDVCGCTFEQIACYLDDLAVACEQRNGALEAAVENAMA
jgi:hypothetical protein